MAAAKKRTTRGVRDAIQKPKSRQGKVTKLGKPIATKAIRGVSYSSRSNPGSSRLTAGRGPQRGVSGESSMGRPVIPVGGAKSMTFEETGSSASRQRSMKAARTMQAAQLKSRMKARRAGVR